MDADNKLAFKQGKLPFIVFLIIHFMVWSVIPLIRKTISLDTMEAVIWGRLFDWGTNKHPPLSGWIANSFYTLCNGHDFGMYVINQIFILIGFIYIYKLARLFLDTPKAMLAVMLLEGVSRYSRSSYEYTCNMVSLAIWPMAVYYFYKGIKDGRIRFWVLFGFIMGLNLLNKYMGGVLLVSMGLYILLTNEGREHLKKPGIYIAGLTTIIVLIPHIIWLYKTDWFSLHYFFGDRLLSKNKFGSWGHIIYPLYFLLIALSLALPTIFAYLLLYQSSKKMPKNNKLNDIKFLILMGILPVILFSFIGVLTGNEVKVTWAFPTYFMLGILLFYFFNFQMTKRIFVKGIVFVYLLMCFMVIERVYFYTTSTHYNRNMDRTEFLNKIEEIWDGPIDYVKGDLYLICTMALLREDKPKVLLETFGFSNPWISSNEVKKGNLLEVYRHPKEGFDSFDFNVTNYWGKSQPITIYYKIFEKQ